MTPYNHGFKVTRRLRNVPFTSLYCPILYVYVDVSVTFNSCHMVYFNIKVFVFHYLFLSCQPKYNLNLLIAASTVRPYLIKTSFWEFSFGLSTRPRQPQHIVPSFTQQELQPALVTVPTQNWPLSNAQTFSFFLHST